MRKIDFSVAQRTSMQEWLRLLPDMAKLIGGWMGDQRVPWRNKATLVGVIVYIISPIDILPDLIPVLGQVDDLAMLGVALRALLTEVDDAVLYAHWAGNRELLNFIQALVEQGTRWLPADVIEWLNGKSPETVDSDAREL
jgi:uncharacterized membrane protein YkvA (DUF1232 family)